MIIDRLIVGPIETNCYIIKLDHDCLIVDPGDEFEIIEEYMQRHNLNLIGILITHYHYDHIGALDHLIDKYKVKVCDYHNLGENKIKKFKFDVINTPGHTSDSVSFYFEENQMMFVGDFIFKNNIGRCDLPTGNFKQMLDSLKRLKKYPSVIVLYPGHGDKTTLEVELKDNPYYGEL